MNTTTNNTIFVTIAAWPDWEIKTDVIQRSAQKQGIELIFVDAGKRWFNYFENKIVRLYDWLGDYSIQHPEIEYMVFADARDAVFVKSRNEIFDLCKHFDDERVWFNVDMPMCTWPVQAEWFASRISLKYGRGGIANSGVYVGRIDRVLELFDRCIALHDFFCSEIESRPGTVEQLIKEAVIDMPGSLFRMKRYSRAETCLASDQFHIQSLQATWDDLVAVDTERIAFAPFADGWPTREKAETAAAQRGRALGERNVDCSARLRASGTMPLGTAGILHSPWLFPRHKMNDESNIDAWTRWAIRENIID